MHWDVLAAMDLTTIEVWTKQGLETFSLLFVLEQSTRKVQLAGPKCLRLPPKSPNLNPHLERFIRSLKEECLDRKIFFGEKSLRTALSEYLSHYHQERNHQGVGNSILEPGVEAGRGIGPVKCREHLGGMLRYYYREAA
jgi:transposase InsO family protein